jgi:hypothetical protein
MENIFNKIIAEYFPSLEKKGHPNTGGLLGHQTNKIRKETMSYYSFKYTEQENCKRSTKSQLIANPSE